MQTSSSTPLFDIRQDQSEWSLIDTLLSSDRVPPPQLLKWIGNKQRFATLIANEFPASYGKYYEPFLGSGAVLGAMSPHEGVVGDILKPLIELWQLLQIDPQKMYDFYKKTWEEYVVDPKKVYYAVLASYNQNPNPLDFLFISRTCYGGVVRFTKQGRMSTPMGPHKPIPPSSFKSRMMLWRNRVRNTTFIHASYEITCKDIKEGDVVYCDPPYIDSQAILYGAQAFVFQDLISEIKKWKKIGAKVALSIDGHKKSGKKIVNINIPEGLFERQLLIDGGSSMLKRFQKKDQIMLGEDVNDRLLLTW